MKKTPPLLLLLGVLVAAAPAQNTLLPIQDLLATPVQRDPYVEIVRCDWLVGARRFAGECWFAGIRGDGTQPNDRTTIGWFTRDQLQTVLGALGLQHGTQVLGGMLVVPEGSADAARQLLDELRQRVPPTIAVDVRFEVTAAGTTRTLLSRSLAVQPGRTCVASDAVVHAAVADYAVEIAQASMIANPGIGEVRTGAMVAIRAQMPLGGEWAVLESVARWVGEDFGQRIDTGHDGLGPLDRLRQHIGETGRVVRVRPGSTTTQTWSDGEQEFRLVLRTQWQLPQPARPGGHDLAVFSMRGDLAGFRSVPVERDNGEERYPPVDPERTDPWLEIGNTASSDAEWLIADTDDEDHDNSLFVAVDRSMWAIGAAATAWFEAQKPAPTVDVRCYDVPAGTPFPEDGTPPADAKPLGGARLDLVDGAWSASAMRDEQTTLHDWDVEVAQSSRIPDPRPRRVSVGLHLNVRSLGDRVELDGELSRIVDPGVQALVLSPPIYNPERHELKASTTGGHVTYTHNDSPAMALVPDRVLVEHPVIARTPLHFARAIDVQRPAIQRQSAANLLGPGHDVVLVVTRPK